MSIKQKLELLRERIAMAAKHSGTDPARIKIVAAVKTVPIEQIIEALEAGITDIGDNRMQEALARQAIIRQKFPLVTWHMIGHLQRNKVRQALDTFDIIQSVDSERIALEIDKRSDKIVPVLIEVNTSGEQTKYGVPDTEVLALFDKLAVLKHLKIIGLMTIGLLSPDPIKVRACFSKLRMIKDKINALNFPNVEMTYLSMGMSQDFEAAIFEGSNMVRVGSLIFGKREG